MTATEAALYDRLVDGKLRAKMGFLTHQNLPLSMYLEYTELGIRPWGGGSGVMSNENIIAYLGVGTVRFDDYTETPPDEEEDDDPDEAEYDYTYYADTDVVTAVWIDNSGGEINPDHGASARFYIPGYNTVYKDYVIPAGESQLVWVKWRTPDKDTTITITVNASRGSARKTTIRCKIIKLVEDTPPNPEGRDRNDGFRLKNAPTPGGTSSLTWGEWWCWWKENWVQVTYTKSDGSTGKRWEDHGWWMFEWNSYQASLTASASIKPDEKVPTARQQYGQHYIKSGYGINAEVQVSVSTNGGTGNTSQVQHIIAVFPEFDYLTYNRLLEPSGSTPGWRDTWAFSPNEFSQFENPVHFTPIWYPDNTKFPVSFTVLDAWTPAGQLTATLTADQVAIDGNVYQDWHIAPGYLEE